MFNEYLHQIDPQNQCETGSGQASGIEALNKFQIVITNDIATTRTIGLFNPAQPSIPDTTITMNGGGSTIGLTYANFCSLMLANPTLLYAVNVTVTNSKQPSPTLPIPNFFYFKRDVNGFAQAIELAPSKDPYQNLSSVVDYDFVENLKCPFLMDGIDTIGLRLGADDTVTMTFYYEQIRLRDIVFSQYLKIPVDQVIGQAQQKNELLNNELK